MPIPITFNGKKYELHHPQSRNEFKTLHKHFGHAMGERPKVVYFWNCALEPGGNLWPNLNWAVEFNISFIRLLKRNGKPITRIDAVRAHTEERAYLGGTKIRPSGIQAALNAVYRPSVFQVPATTFLKFMHPKGKYVVLAWAERSPVWVKRAGTQTDEGFWLLVPVAVHFAAIPYGWCGEIAPAGLKIGWKSAFTAIEDKRVRPLYVRGVTSLAFKDLGWTHQRDINEYDKLLAEKKAARNRDAVAIQKRYAKALGGR